jgi:hypothetical protein
MIFVVVVMWIDMEKAPSYPKAYYVGMEHDIMWHWFETGPPNASPANGSAADEWHVWLLQLKQVAKFVFVWVLPVQEIPNNNLNMLWSSWQYLPVQDIPNNNLNMV